jgi:hypothetical protein
MTQEYRIDFIQTEPGLVRDPEGHWEEGRINFGYESVDHIEPIWITAAGDVDALKQAEQRWEARKVFDNETEGCWLVSKDGDIEEIIEFYIR